MPDFGISAEKSGTATANGNASTAVFTIAHGLGMTPSYISVQGTSVDTDDDFYFSADATNITVTFAFPPPTGTSNLTFIWRVGA